MRFLSILCNIYYITQYIFLISRCFPTLLFLCHLFWIRFVICKSNINTFCLKWSVLTFLFPVCFLQCGLSLSVYATPPSLSVYVSLTLPPSSFVVYSLSQCCIFAATAILWKPHHHSLQGRLCVSVGFKGRAGLSCEYSNAVGDCYFPTSYSQTHLYFIRIYSYILTSIIHAMPENTGIHSMSRPGMP